MRRQGRAVVWGGLAMVLMRPAVAQTVFSGEVSQSISGVSAVAVDTASGDSETRPLLSNATSIRLRALANRPRLSFGVDLRVSAGLDPTFLRQTDDAGGEGTTGQPDATGSLSGIGLGSRVQPELTLALNGRPKEWLSLGLLSRTSAFKLLNRDEYAVDGTATVQEPTSDLTNVPGETSSLDPAALQEGLALQGLLPQDSWSTELMATAGLTGERRFTPQVAAQYRLYRQFECAESVGGFNTAYNVERDTLAGRGSMLMAFREDRRFTATLSGSREDSRPLQECMPEPDPEDPTEQRAQRAFYYQVSPTLSWSYGREPFTVTLEAGGSIVWGRAWTEESGMGPVGGLDPRPVGLISVRRGFPWGDLRGQTGVRIATLLGHPAPTYNWGTDLSVAWRPHPKWGLRGGVSAVQAFLLNEYFIENGAIGTTLLVGQTGLDWRPISWFSGQLGYALTFQNNRSVGGTIYPGTPIGSGPGYNQVLLNTVSVMATFSLDGGLTAMLLPKLADRP